VTAFLGAAAGPSASAVPAFALRVGGLPLPPPALGDVVAVSATQDVELPGMFTIRLLDWDQDRLRTTWSDSTLFDPGTAVEVALGYVGALTTVLTGEVTGLELEIEGDEPPAVVVRGYDRRHRLLRGQLTRSFVGVSDSDMARRIGAERGLAVRAVQSPVRYAHVLQHNQTDLEFLAQRAARIGYEVALDDRTLLFRPRRAPGVPTGVLRRDVDLLSFFPRLTTMGQTSGVAVQGRNPGRPGEQVRAVAGTDDPSAKGSPASAALPGVGAVDIGNRTLLRPVADRAEAKALADALAESTTRWQITGTGTCIGRPDVRAGARVRIEGLGSRFSGTYLVTAATHSYAPGIGYRTTFQVTGEIR
jgi:phage protein D